MAENNREKRKLTNIENETSEIKKIRRKSRSSKLDAVATEQPKINKTSNPKTRSSRLSKITQNDEKESRTDSENNNNGVAIRKRISETPIPHCSKQIEPKNKLTPTNVRQLGDDVGVLIEVDNTNDFGISNEEMIQMAQIESRNQKSGDEMTEELDYDDDLRNTESDLSDDQGELIDNQFDETASSLVENEVFFNFKRPPSQLNIVDVDSDTMEEVIERLVNKQLQSEKEKLREEYQLLEQMQNEYKALLREKEKKNDNPETSNKGNHNPMINQSSINKTPKHNNVKETRAASAVESPSDTTIYAPRIS